MGTAAEASQRHPRRQQWRSSQEVFGRTPASPTSLLQRRQHTRRREAGLRAARGTLQRPRQHQRWQPHLASPPLAAALRGSALLFMVRICGASARYGPATVSRPTRNFFPLPTSAAKEGPLPLCSTTVPMQKRRRRRTKRRQQRRCLCGLVQCSKNSFSIQSNSSGAAPSEGSAAHKMRRTPKSTRLMRLRAVISAAAARMEPLPMLSLLSPAVASPFLLSHSPAMARTAARIFGAGGLTFPASRTAATCSGTAPTKTCCATCRNYTTRCFRSSGATPASMSAARRPSLCAPTTRRRGRPVVALRSTDSATPLGIFSSSSTGRAPASAPPSASLASSGIGSTARSSRPGGSAPASLKGTSSSPHLRERSPAA